MRYRFYREHKYVSAALNDLERLIARTDFQDAIALERVRGSFESLASLLKGHAEYENERLHVLLKQKNSSVYAHVEEDHAAQDEQLFEIEKIIKELSRVTDAEKKLELGYHLYLTYRKFVADNLAHLHEEETQILPELQKLYSDAELQQVEASSYRAMTPEEMVHMLQTLFPEINTHDRKAILVDILTLEPQKFALAWKDIRSMLSEDERTAIEIFR